MDTHTSPIFTGSATALITPFNDKGIDVNAFAKSVDFQIANGTNALVVCGTTGEPSTMTRHERTAAIKLVIEKTAKRVPVIAGTGSNDTARAIEASIEAAHLGADALLVVTPYYNRCNNTGLIAHYKAIAESVKLPIIAYNVPSRTGVNITPNVALELSKIKNIVAIKEASGNIDQISEIARLTHGKLDLYSGDDGNVIPVFAMGGVGVISVVSNAIPKQFAEMCAFLIKGDYEKARNIHFSINAFTKAIFAETNPIGIKTALNLMGHNAGKLRLPLCEMEKNNLDALKAEMVKMGLIN